MSEPTYEVVWPLSSRGAQRRKGAERLPTLDGRRVVFLWDYLFRGEELFPALAGALRTRYPGVDIVDYDVVGNIHGADEQAVIASLPHRLGELGADAVVVGMGC